MLAPIRPFAKRAIWIQEQGFQTASRSTHGSRSGLLAVYGAIVVVFQRRPYSPHLRVKACITNLVLESPSQQVTAGLFKRRKVCCIGDRGLSFSGLRCIRLAVSCGSISIVCVRLSGWSIFCRRLVQIIFPTVSSIRVAAPESPAYSRFLSSQ
jgi:hypothetical protein